MSAIVKMGEKVETVRGMLEKYRPQLMKALPKHLTPEKYARIVMTAVQKTPELLDCDPRSLMGAVIQAAQLGLEPDSVLGYSWILPYGKNATFIPGYKGLLKLVRQSGEVSSVEARVVREGDHFRWRYGLREELDHRPMSYNPNAEITAAYAIARLRDGGVQWDVMERLEIEGIRARSPAGKRGPWVTDFPEMAKKTVIRRLCKMLPTSTERAEPLARAVAQDERFEADNPEIFRLEEPPEEPEIVGDALDQIATRRERKRGGGHQATEPANEAPEPGSNG